MRTKIDPPLIFDLTNMNIKKIRKNRGDKKKTMSTPIRYNMHYPNGKPMARRFRRQDGRLFLANKGARTCPLECNGPPSHDGVYCVVSLLIHYSPLYFFSLNFGSSKSNYFTSM
jgi:hypothetical protein